MKMFRNYRVVGGMPQAVSAYIEGKDYLSIDRVKRNIIKLYIQDKKHDDVDGDRALLIFKSLPEQLMNHNSVFRYSVIDENARNRNCSNAIDFFQVYLIVSIEVKSSNYRSHKSFDYFKEKYQLKMNERYIIYKGFRYKGWYCLYTCLYDYVFIIIW